jgi:HTH-type transcriptional regulator / antitoxin HipB
MTFEQCRRTVTSVEYAINAWDRIGALVREERRRAGLTQAQLAELAHVSRGWLIQLENGHPNAEPLSVLPVLRALDLELVARPTRPDATQLEEEALLDDLLGG